MTKKLVLSIFIFITLIGNLSAETPEILINPSSEEYTRLSSGLSGSNITIISKEDLKTQYGKNLPQILETYSGINVRRLYDGVGGTNSSLDIRGFGEASKSNSLILVNGIRLNDIDMSTPELLAKKDAEMLRSLNVSRYFQYIFLTFLGQGSGDRVRHKTS